MDLRYYILYKILMVNHRFSRQTRPHKKLMVVFANQGCTQAHPVPTVTGNIRSSLSGHIHIEVPTALVNSKTLN